MILLSFRITTARNRVNSYHGTTPATTITNIGETMSTNGNPQHTFHDTDTGTSVTVPLDVTAANLAGKPTSFRLDMIHHDALTNMAVDQYVATIPETLPADMREQYLTDLRQRCADEPGLAAKIISGEARMPVFVDAQPAPRAETTHPASDPVFDGLEVA